MLVTPDANRRNQQFALAAAGVVIVTALGLGYFVTWWWVPGVLLAPLVYWWLRRECRRRLWAMAQPFPRVWEGILRSRVSYYGALDEDKRERFRQMVKVFLDETRITGIRTDVDETTRVLVAASAVIPVLNFPDWEYSRLGEVLIYPSDFDDSFQSDGKQPRNILGMVGDGHLSGVMILSKPALHMGFDIANDRKNVGIHEFAHLVDKGDGSIDGIPPGVPPELFRKWVKWVTEELQQQPEKSHIRDYAYTNEAEYFAVLVEYFFEAPAILQQKNPVLYEMLEKMFRQDTVSLLRGARPRARRIGRNSRCPCGSGEKYKKCCLRNAVRGVPRD